MESFDKLLSEAVENLGSTKPDSFGNSDNVYLVTIEEGMIFLARLYQQALYCLPLAIYEDDVFAPGWNVSYRAVPSKFLQTYRQICKTYLDVEFMDPSVTIDWDTPVGFIFKIANDDILALDNLGTMVSPWSLEPLLVINNPSERALSWLKETSRFGNLIHAEHAAPSGAP